MVDQISDMLTRIRNAQMAEHKTVIIPLSKIKLEIVKILKKEGYINNFSAKKNFLEIDLKFPAAINEIKRISKPGRRFYIKSDKIKPIKNGYGTSIISTPMGLMTNKEARKAGLGGEVLLEIW